MKIKKFIKAHTINEVTKALEEFNGEIQIIAGGTDLSVKIRDGENDKAVIVDISDVSDMNKIEFSDNKLLIGSAVKFAEVEECIDIKNEFKGLWAAAKSVGAPQIRNLGTIGGNIANGSPAADIVPPLLALNACVTLESSNGKRILNLRDIYIGKGKVDIKEDEVLTFITIDRIKEKYYIEFEKLGLRNALAIARLSTSLYLEKDENNIIEKIRVASGSLGLYPMRELKLEEFMVGKKLDKNLMIESANVYSGIVYDRLHERSTCEFKKEAVKGIFLKAIEKCL
ncbi:FAD binding domain-containing protein [Helicovermis profundi]|uniref:Xanthine dehydrogenase FAD-binding subunit XdhB n=1 Tax=Helicovermis profundi TaxID=3065157 RepID=A0AAU9E3Z0_9FIRM|nr:xanthine dehydrogenase FAD-binding subunit XdhB [Clostridia bacterium S502]